MNQECYKVFETTSCGFLYTSKKSTTFVVLSKYVIINNKFGDVYERKILL